MPWALLNFTLKWLTSDWHITLQHKDYVENILLTPMKMNSEIIFVGISKYSKHYAGKHNGMGNGMEKMNNVHATERNKKYLKPVVLKYKISPVHNTLNLCTLWDETECY